MIARHWRGLARAHRAAHYLKHLRTETFPALQGLPGFVDAPIRSRPLVGGVEFLIITGWASLEAIGRGFSGGDVEVAVVQALAVVTRGWQHPLKPYECPSPHAP